MAPGRLAAVVLVDGTGPRPARGPAVPGGAGGLLLLLLLLHLLPVLLPLPGPPPVQPPHPLVVTLHVDDGGNHEEDEHQENTEAHGQVHVARINPIAPGAVLSEGAGRGGGGGGGLQGRRSHQKPRIG